MSNDIRNASDGLAKTIDRRRQLLALAGFGALVAMPISSALAYFPSKKNPSPLDDLITRLTLVIYTGRLSRQVWIKEELAKKLYTQGAVIDPAELRLQGLSEIDVNHANTGFFEIEDAKPILKNPDAISLPLYRGRVYCSGYRSRDGILEVEKFVGQELIFLFDGFRTGSVLGPSFPKPMYACASDGHWRDILPIPISQLKTVTSIAKRAGFVVPTKRNSSLPSSTN